MYISRAAETNIFNLHLTHIAGIVHTPHMVQFMARLNCTFSHCSTGRSYGLSYQWQPVHNLIIHMYYIIIAFLILIQNYKSGVGGGGSGGGLVQPL